MSETVTQGTTEPQVQAPAPTEQAPKWFLEYQEKTDGRLAQIGKDFGRVRDKIGIKEESGEPALKPSAANAQAGVKLGRMIDKLPGSAKDYFEKAIVSGERSYTELLREAELISMVQPAGAMPSESAKKAPTGIAASAAPRTAPAPYPETWAEFISLKKSNPELYRELSNPEHPSFDITSLRHTTRTSRLDSHKSHKD